MFSFGDLVLMKVLVKLLDAGIPVYRLGKALKSFQKRHQKFLPTQLAGALLVTDGRQIFLKQHGVSALEELASGQLSFAFVIEIEKLCEEINEKISEAVR